MANSATLVDEIPSYFKNGVGPVFEYEIVIDTNDTDLVVRAPFRAENRIWVVGILGCEENDGHLVLKSDSGKTQTVELGAWQGFYDKVSPGYIFVTLPGEDLVIQASMNITASVGSNLILRVVEAPRFEVY